MLLQRRVLLRRIPELVAVLGAPVIDDRQDAAGRTVRQIARYEVHVMSGEARWTNYVRYREFHAVHGLLVKAVPGFNATLPPKTLLSGVGAQFVQERGTALSRWLAQAMRFPAVSSSFEMRGFLSPREDSTGDVGWLSGGRGGGGGGGGGMADLGTGTAGGSVPANRGGLLHTAFFEPGDGGVGSGGKEGGGRTSLASGSKGTGNGGHRRALTAGPARGASSIDVLVPHGLAGGGRGGGEGGRPVLHRSSSSSATPSSSMGTRTGAVVP